MGSRHPCSERGQSLVFFLVLLLGLVAFVGLVIDGANAFGEKRRVQNAADAAALAAVQDLKAVATCADEVCREGYRNSVRAAAEQYSHENGGAGTLAQCSPSVRVDCYTWPYPDNSAVGNWNRVEVRLRNTVDGFFTNFLGLGNSFFKPQGRAVAGMQYTPGTPPTPSCPAGSTYNPSTNMCEFPPTLTCPSGSTYDPSDGLCHSPPTIVGGAPSLLYTASTTCPSIKISGQNNIFYGAIETRGGVDISGDTSRGDLLIWGGSPPLAPDCLKLHSSFVSPSCDLATTPGCWHKIQTNPATPWPVAPPCVWWQSACATSTPNKVYWNGTTVDCTPLTPFLVGGKVKVKLAPGLYCLNNPITIDFNTGESMKDVGLVGTKITISNDSVLDCSVTANPCPAGQEGGGYQGLMPEHGGLLFLGTDTGANVIQFQGANVRWRGGIFAPNGDAKLSGASGTVVNGFIESQTVDFSGCCATWHGTGPISGGTVSPGSTTPPTASAPPPVAPTMSGGSNPSFDYGLDE